MVTGFMAIDRYKCEWKLIQVKYSDMVAPDVRYTNIQTIPG